MYLETKKIGMQYGYPASDYFTALIAEGDMAALQIYKIHKQVGELYGSGDEIDKAIENGFRYDPKFDEKDDKLRKQYRAQKKLLPDLIRREAFSERLKDSLVLFGIGSIVIFIIQLLNMYEKRRLSRFYARD